MPDHLQNFYFARHALHIGLFDDLSFFKYLDGHFFPGQDVSAKFDLAKSALTDIFADYIMTN